MSTLVDDLRRALDASGPGPVELDVHGVPVELEVRRHGPVGVELDGLRLRPPARDLEQRSRELCAGFRPRGERLLPIELDPALGGAVLRTRPEDIRRGRYFEVNVETEAVEVRRWRRRPEGGREAQPIPLSHEELGDWLEELVPDGAGPGAGEARTGPFSRG